MPNTLGVEIPPPPSTFADAETTSPRYTRDVGVEADCPGENKMPRRTLKSGSGDWSAGTRVPSPPRLTWLRRELAAPVPVACANLINFGVKRDHI
jgi:hypothetical protein